MAMATSSRGAGEIRASTATLRLSTMVAVSIKFARTAPMIGRRIVSQVERLLNSWSVGGEKISKFKSCEAAISSRSVQIKVRFSGRESAELDLEL